eukprot:332401-Chlamydomonas_euryale.AAC.1
MAATRRGRRGGRGRRNAGTRSRGASLPSTRLPHPAVLACMASPLLLFREQPLFDLAGGRQSGEATLDPPHREPQAPVSRRGGCGGARGGARPSARARAGWA